MTEPTPIIDAGLAELEPTAWRWHWLAGDEPDVWAYCETAVHSDGHRYAEPLYGPSLLHRLRTSEARAEKAEAKVARLVGAIARIADDYYPSHPREDRQALSEMREALSELAASHAAGSAAQRIEGRLHAIRTSLGMDLAHIETFCGLTGWNTTDCLFKNDNGGTFIAYADRTKADCKMCFHAAPPVVGSAARKEK